MPDAMVERMSAWAKDQVELPNLLSEISWQGRRRVRRHCRSSQLRPDLLERTVGSILSAAKSPMEGHGRGGLVFAAIFLATAVRLRRYREAIGFACT